MTAYVDEKTMIKERTKVKKSTLNLFNKKEFEENIIKYFGKKRKQIVTVVSKGVTGNWILNSLSSMGSIKIDEILKNQKGFGIACNGIWQTIVVEENGRDSVEVIISAPKPM